MLLSLALLIVDHRYHHLESLRAALSVVVAPLQYLANAPLALSRWAGDTLATREQLESDNRRLRQDNLLLRARLQKFESLQAENLRLRDLLDSSFKVGERVLIAELSAVDLDPYKQLVVINKGSRSGVYAGQPVLDADAVMGQVTHVNPLSATVLLITDASHALPVQVLRNGLRTVANGTGRVDELSLPYLPQNADIREGDLLVTSGLGGLFPPGYPVARVSRIERQPGQHFASISATPQAHLDRSREVLLVWMLDKLNRPADGPDKTTPAAPPQSATGTTGPSP